MENKHFSHIHNLGLHQMPQGNQISCSGCKFQDSGWGTGSGLFYVCWECKFFLHEQCFKASRYMQHPSHPTHPLTLAPYPTYPSNSFFCNSCNLVGTGLSYGCSLCEFDLHVHCAYMSKPHESFPNNPYQNHPIPNNMHQNSESVPSYPYPNYNPQHDHNNYHAPNYNPQHPYMPQTSTPHANENVPTYYAPNLNPESREIKKHFSHVHPLHMSKMRKNEIKLCSGCEENILTSAYSCMESQCDFNLHISCFNMPREIRHNSHPKHHLTLITSSPETNGYTCNACLRKGFAFSYNCSDCDVDLHVDCASLPTTVKRQDHEHALSLLFYTPYKKPGEEKDIMGECDVCYEIAPDAAWIYYCRKCDFGTHTYCVNSKAKEKPVLGKSEMAHISGAQTVMEKLMEAKIKHDSNSFILHYLI